MKIIIDTEAKTCKFEDEPVMNNVNIADEFEKHIGATEYNGIVADIQKWYYGSLVKASWCATSLSYFANKIGKLNSIGGKNENVCMMMNSCKKAASQGLGTFFDKSNIPAVLEKGDLLFFLWNGTVMTTTSSKHVGVSSCNQSSTGATVGCLGGNQDDMINIKAYPTAQLYAVYRIK